MLPQLFLRQHISFVVHSVLLHPAFWRALEAFVDRRGKAENDRCIELALESERASADIPHCFSVYVVRFHATFKYIASRKPNR